MFVIALGLPSVPLGSDTEACFGQLRERQRGKVSPNPVRGGEVSERGWLGPCELCALSTSARDMNYYRILLSRLSLVKFSFAQDSV